MYTCSSQNLTKNKKSVPINNHIFNQTHAYDTMNKLDIQSVTTDAKSSQVNSHFLFEKKGFALNNYQNLQQRLKLKS